MATKTKTPVFFIATKAREEPVMVNFYTKSGEPIAFRAITKIKTKKGVHFYAKASKSKSR